VVDMAPFLKKKSKSAPLVSAEHQLFALQFPDSTLLTMWRRIKVVLARSPHICVNTNIEDVMKTWSILPGLGPKPSSSIPAGLALAGICFIRDTNALLELWYKSQQKSEQPSSRTEIFNNHLKDYRSDWCRYENRIVKFAVTGYRNRKSKDVESFVSLIQFNHDQYNKYFTEPGHEILIATGDDLKRIHEMLRKEIGEFVRIQLAMRAAHPGLPNPPIMEWL
jgi:hypothetical protein